MISDEIDHLIFLIISAIEGKLNIRILNKSNRPVLNMTVIPFVTNSSISSSLTNIEIGPNQEYSWNVNYSALQAEIGQFLIAFYHTNRIYTALRSHMLPNTEFDSKSCFDEWYCPFCGEYIPKGTYCPLCGQKHRSLTEEEASSP